MQSNIKAVDYFFSTSFEVFGVGVCGGKLVGLGFFVCFGFYSYLFFILIFNRHV